MDGETNLFSALCNIISCSRCSNACKPATSLIFHTRPKAHTPYKARDWAQRLKNGSSSFSSSLRVPRSKNRNRRIWPPPARLPRAQGIAKGRRRGGLAASIPRRNGGSAPGQRLAMDARPPLGGSLKLDCGH
jgi:hypothetical protein